MLFCFLLVIYSHNSKFPFIKLSFSHSVLVQPVITAQASINQSPVSISLFKPAPPQISSPIYIISHLPQPITEQGVVQIQPDTDEREDEGEVEEVEEAEFLPIHKEENESDAVSSLLTSHPEVDELQTRHSKA